MSHHCNSCLASELDLIRCHDSALAFCALTTCLRRAYRYERPLRTAFSLNWSLPINDSRSSTLIFLLLIQVSSNFSVASRFSLGTPIVKSTVLIRYPM